MTPSDIAALLSNILYAAAPLIALTNPFSELPVFLSIVKDWSDQDARRAALKVAVGVWLVLVISATSGLQLLGLIGIEISAFHAAGGLLLILMGIEMLQGREPLKLMDPENSEDDPEDALWVPLVIPMLAGPGAIVTTVSLTVREPLVRSWFPLATLIAVTLAAGVVFVTLRLATMLARRVSRRGQRIFTRFSGMILVAIGFQMGFTGAAEFFLR